MKKLHILQYHLLTIVAAALQEAPDFPTYTARNPKSFGEINGPLRWNIKSPQGF